MIHNYKLYIFDLDGTIIDSEYSHYQAYNSQLTNKISFEEYENIFHDEKNKNKFITENNICKLKKESDFVDIYNNNAKFIEGFLTFFEELIEKGKDIIIVTNSSEKRINFILKKHPILNNVNKILTKNDMKKCKPNPECYINVINNTRYNINDIIIFEDSYTGYNRIYRCRKGFYM
jgi:HAD superfamily hydrolase (TIGR01509 family)